MGVCIHLYSVCVCVGCMCTFASAVCVCVLHTRVETKKHIYLFVKEI